ncbi:MAG: hypothetical protein E7166_06110 [Firmicutes bacterium]|nr:hypothetical protein [Bacillota bacterium]
MQNKNNKNVVFVVILVVSVVTSFLLGQFLESKSISMFNYSLAQVIDINKIDNNKEIVYSGKTYIPNKLPVDLNIDEVRSELPIINLNYDSVKSINEEINKKYNELKDDNIITEDMVNINSVKYKYYVNDNILSLVIEYKNYNYTAGYVSYEYKSYNIDKNNGKVLTNNELINLKNLTNDKVYNNIVKNIENEYEDLGYDDYKNTDFYRETINNIGKNNNINVSLFLDADNNLSTYLNIRMNMGPGTITRNFILK